MLQTKAGAHVKQKTRNCCRKSYKVSSIGLKPVFHKINVRLYSFKNSTKGFLSIQLFKEKGSIFCCNCQKLYHLGHE